jgi:hypothetical protein
MRPSKFHSGGLKVMLLAPSVKVVTRFRTSTLTSHDDKPNVRSKSGKLKENISFPATTVGYILLCTVQNKITSVHVSLGCQAI